MKRIILLFLLSLIFLLCGCVSTGETDVTDFTVSMAEYGYDCIFEESLSSQTLSHYTYIDRFRLRLNCNNSGAVVSLSITCAGKSDERYIKAAKAAVSSLCGFPESRITEIFDVISVNSMPDTTCGVNRCESGGFVFTFTADEAGGILVAENLRLNPTVAPSVTVRTTLPSVH